MGALRRWLTAAAVVCATLSTATARAQDRADELGKKLFAEGKRAMEASDYATACAKFEESYKASGVPGSLLNWADCEEHRSRFATALALWRQGEAKVVQNAERRDFVAQRIRAVAPKVPRISFEFATTGLANVVVKIDGSAVDLGAGPTPLDPGDHEIVATAAPSARDRLRVTVSVGESKRVVLFDPSRPPLPEDAAPVAPSLGPGPQPPPPPADAGTALKIGGFISGGLGIASLIGFAVTTGLIYDTCGGDIKACPSDQKSRVDSLGIANGVTLALGAAGVVTGAVLLGIGFTRESGPRRALSVLVSPGPAGVIVRGTF